MNLDEIDIKILRENFCDETISELDKNNLEEILKYLNDNGVYYSKDLLLTSLDLFLLPKEEFIKRFEKLKNKLGSNYVEKLGEDIDTLIALKWEIEKLKEPEKTIIYQKFFEDLTQEKIAQNLNLTQVDVSRREKKALTKIRKSFN